MTNGEPLLVRAAIKPISTLTKPLRSVDTETKEPAQALRERTDSTVVPAAGVVGEAMVAPDPGRAATGRSSAATTSTTSWRRSRPTSSGSAGALSSTRPAIVFIGFMGAGKSTGAGSRRPRALGAASRSTTDASCWSASSASRSPTPSSAHGEDGFRSPRGRGRRRAAGPRRRGRDRARRRQRVVGQGARGPRAPSRRLAAGRRGDRLAADPGHRPPAGDQPRRRRAAAGRAAAALRAAGRRDPAWPAILDRRPGPAGDRGAARPARQERDCCWASSDSGQYPVLVGEGLLGAGWWPLGGDRFCVTDSTVGPLYGDRLGRLAARIDVAPGEQAKSLAEAERVLRELAAAGMTRADHLVALGGGVVGDLAGFCAPPTSAGSPSSRRRPRWSPRSTPPTAARPVSTFPRPRTTSAPTTSRQPCSPTPGRCGPCPQRS